MTIHGIYGHRSCIAIVVGYLLAAGCASSSNAEKQKVRGVALAANIICFDAACRDYSVLPMIRSRSRYGTRCMGNTPPGEEPNEKPAPESFLISDVGKPGFPTLRPFERRIVIRIRHFAKSSFLRIAWVDDASTTNNFIVFDAIDGPCEVSAPGYGVLNGECAEVYEPGENPYITHDVPSCYPMKRPWMSGS